MLVMHHTGVVSDGVRRFQKTGFWEGEAVDVREAVAALGGNIFIEGVPGDTLDVVGVFSYFLHAFAWKEHEREAVTRS